MKKVWGDRPSELALMAYNYLSQSIRYKSNKDIFILDIGCGYGRDAIFLASKLPCHILGVDSSEEGIAMARASLSGELKKRIELLAYDFSRVNDKYDVIFAANLYEGLKPAGRAKLTDTIKRCLKTGGVFFLSALSVNDPQHSSRAEDNNKTSVPDADYSHLHFSTREGLEKDFSFLKIHALYEREYEEPRAKGANHHHISWLLLGSTE
jgi:cyclopropane fatty-acyl-phospholipid synthase-like methyltransferase